MSRDPSDQILDMHLGTTRLEVDAASIAEPGPGWDVVASPDDNYLTHGGGASRAIWRAAGQAMSEAAALRSSTLTKGDVFWTPGGNLPVRECAHAVTLDLNTGDSVGSGGLSALYGRVLDECRERAHHAVALPLLGTGAAGIPLETSVYAFSEALALRLDTRFAPRRIGLFCLPKDFAESAAALLGERFRTWKSLGDLVYGDVESWVRLEGADEIILSLLTGSGLPSVWGGTDDLPFLRLLDSVAAALGRIGARTAGGGSASIERRPVPLGVNLRTFVENAAAHGLAVSKESGGALRRAVEARNRIVHGLQSPDAADLGNLVHGLRVAFFHLLQAAHLQPGPLGADERTRQLEGQRREWRNLLSAIPPDRPSAPGPVTLVTAAESAVDPRGSGTRHARVLRDFLLETISQEELEEMDSNLRARGLSGEPADILLEECLHTDDPERLLSEHAGHAVLKRQYRKRLGRTPDEAWQKRRLAREILISFGFPRQGQPLGLSVLRSRLKRLASEVSGADSASDIRGKVGMGAVVMEQALQVLIRAISHAVFGQRPEAFFEGQPEIPKSGSLDKASLGSLLSLTGELGRRLQRDDRGQMFFGIRDGENLVTQSGSTVARVRNAFLHFSGEKTPRTLDEARSEARVFFEGSLEFLATLEKHGYFPAVILVEEIRLDRWGRRRVRARTDEGLEEIVYSDEDLKPGEVYFMYTKTNPSRVDPALLPAGIYGLDHEADVPD